MKKTILRKIIYPAILKSGFLNKLRDPKKTLILNYHGVLPKPDFSISNNHISVEQFEQHILYIKKNFNLISPEDTFSNRPINAKPNIAITFDDGYENNYKYAFPVLKKYNVKATIFIISEAHKNEGYITWYDQIDFFKKYSFNQRIRLSELYKSEEIQTEDWKKFKSFLKTQSQFKKKEIINKIKNSLKVDEKFYKKNEPLWKMMNKKQIKELSDSGLVEIGSHTVSHPNLSEIELVDVENEVKQSKIELEEITDKKILSIAFPDGSYNEKVKEICLINEYKRMYAVDLRCEKDKNDPFIRPRFSLSNTTTFEANILSFYKAFNKFGF